MEVFESIDKHIIVRVKDTGIGISEEEQARLFNAFIQADNSTSKKFGGTGLGLALSKEISHLMKGGITINSKEGEGAEFIFQCTLEVLKGAVVPASQAMVDDPMREEGSQTSLITSNNQNIADLRILVVEDNEINQLVVEAILGSLGVKPVVVNNGLEAVERVQQEEFDVVLMDCQMPVLDGYKATEKIRQIDKFKFLPIFALTADATEDSKKKAYDVGFTGHLSKPILVDKLLEKLESI